MGLGLERIPEEDEQVELASRDHRPDLLIAAERAALKLDYLEFELALDDRTGGSGGIQIMGRECVAVEPCPLQQIGLFVVVRNEGNPLGIRLAEQMDLLIKPNGLGATINAKGDGRVTGM